MNRNRKKQISILLTLSLLVGLFCQLVPSKSVGAADAAVQVELQQISRPNEVEKGIAEGLGELVVQRIDTEKKTLKAYSKFSIEERGWVWIANTVNTTYPGNASSSTLYTNAALTKMITPDYKKHDELGERLYAYYLDPGTYYLETELYSYFIGVDLPLKQAVYGYFLPSSQVISVEIEMQSDAAQLHCTSAMSDAAYYWVKDTSTVDKIGNTKDFYKNVSIVSDIEVDSNGEYSICAVSQLQEWEHYPVDIHVTVEGIGNIQESFSPVPSPEGQAYVWCGEYSGWGGPNSYPSSANHVQGSGEENGYYKNMTNIGFATGYGCGLELMNPYSPYLQGTDNEMAQFIKKMKNPRIKVTLENGGAASVWNWDTELSFPSGKEMVLPDGYLDTGYFALFGNDDVITKVEFYDAGQSGGQTTSTPRPLETDAPDTNRGSAAVYHHNLSIYNNQRSDERMMEYLLMEPDNVYAYLINDEIREVCREITKNCNTDMEKLQAIHDWVCNNLYYENIDNGGEGTGVGAIWVFYHRGTRCEGYADLTAAMCREVGIPCKEMEGYGVPKNIEGMTAQEILDLASSKPNMRHMWNEAWVDGRWVLLDTTWDSQNYSHTSDSEVIYQPCKQTYFDMGLEEFSKTHLFASHISFFEVMFDEWNQKVNSDPPENTTQPSTEPTNHPDTNADSKQGDQSTGTAGGKKKKIIQKPGRVKIKKIKKAGGLCAKVTWGKVKCNDGYQIQYSRKRNFSGKKTTTSSSKSAYIWGKRNKTYYVRVRAVNWGWKSQSQYGYKYGKWSKVKKVRLK